MVKNRGYPVEAYETVSPDDYRIVIHRIPGPKGALLNETKENPGKPVLLGHDLGHSAHNWIMNDDELSLAFNLAEEGYDVWLINFRGSHYSQGHKNWNITANETDYWDFTLLQQGIGDISTGIDAIFYVRNITNEEKKIAYVGMGTGATSFMLGALTEKEKY